MVLYVDFWRLVVPLLPHVDFVAELEGVVAVGEELQVLDDARKGAEDAHCLHALGVDLLQVELLVLGEVLHVGFEEAQLAGVSLFGGETRVTGSRLLQHNLNYIKMAREGIIKNDEMASV